MAGAALAMLASHGGSLWNNWQHKPACQGRRCASANSKISVQAHISVTGVQVQAICWGTTPCTIFQSGLPAQLLFRRTNDPAVCLREGDRQEHFKAHMLWSASQVVALVQGATEAGQPYILHSRGNRVWVAVHRWVMEELQGSDGVLGLWGAGHRCLGEQGRYGGEHGSLCFSKMWAAPQTLCAMEEPPQWFSRLGNGQKRIDEAGA